MDLTLILAAIIGSWFLVWGIASYMQSTAKPRAVLRGWRAEARVIQGRKIR
jgi:hypothetical protein